MFYKNFSFIFLILFAFQSVLSRPTTEDAKNVTKAALIIPSSNASAKQDAEVIDINAIVKPDEDAYRKAAAENGMDPEIVAEVIRNQKPVIKTEFDENGTKRTTTYKLEPDGSISRHTLAEYKPKVEKIHKPQSLDNSQKSAATKIDKDWEWNPPTISKSSPPTTQTFTFPQFTPTWQIPTFSNENPFEHSPFQPRHPNQEGTTTVRLPETWNTNLWPNTNTFEHIDPSNSGTVTKTVVKDDGTKVTTTHTVGPTKWTTRTITYPGISSSWPTLSIETTTPFPSLEDFLKSQYGTTTIRPFTSRISNNNKPVTTINVEDLPAVKFSTNDITPEDRIPTLTPNIQTQTKTYTKTIQSNGPPTAADLDPKMKEILDNAGISPEDLLKSKNGTITKTRRDPDGKIITTTYRVHTVPNNNGVSLSDLPDFDTPKFTNTFDLHTPRGPFFIVDTTTVTPPLTHFSSSHNVAKFPVQHLPPPPSSQNHHDFDTDFDFLKPNWQRNFHGFEMQPDLNSNKPTLKTPIKLNPINEFLKKVGLSSESFTNSNGEVVKTILDDEGRVLSATFVLSTVKSNEKSSEKNVQQEPIK